MNFKIITKAHKALLFLALLAPMASEGSFSEEYSEENPVYIRVGRMSKPLGEVLQKRGFALCKTLSWGDALYVHQNDPHDPPLSFYVKAASNSKEEFSSEKKMVVVNGVCVTPYKWECVQPAFNHIGSKIVPSLSWAYVHAMLHARPLTDGHLFRSVDSFPYPQAVGFLQATKRYGLQFSLDRVVEQKGSDGKYQIFLACDKIEQAPKKASFVFLSSNCDFEPVQPSWCSRLANFLCPAHEEGEQDE